LDQYSFLWFDIDNLHNFSFLLGQEIQHNQTKQSFIKNRYFPRSISADKHSIKWIGNTLESTSSLSLPNALLHSLDRQVITTTIKYLASITFRADGSTKYLSGEQWGYFPSISGAWVLSKESFLENNPIISNLKLRAAIGLAGNNRN
jgi:hypothetical protein